jgi:hypothetical protein
MSAALEAGISRRTLYAMHADGVLERLSRGVYRLTSLPGLEAPDLVAVTTRVPRGVVCLISAIDDRAAPRVRTCLQDGARAASLPGSDVVTTNLHPFVRVRRTRPGRGSGRSRRCSSTTP